MSRSREIAMERDSQLEKYSWRNIKNERYRDRARDSEREYEREIKGDLHREKEMNERKHVV